MIDTNILSNSLQVSLHELSWLAKNLLRPNDKNYIWTAVERNLFATVEIRPRAGYFDIPWQPNSLFPIPDLEQPFNKTLAQVYDERSIEIFNQSQQSGKRIVIMWSGGIDSTSMLCAFIKNLSTDQLKSIVVCTTTEGIAENTFFYETQIRKRFDLLHLRDLDFSDQFLDRHILLHGDPGDCIFGPSVARYRHLWQDDQYLRPWKDSRHLLYHMYHDNNNLDFSSWFVNGVCDNLSDLQDQGLYTNLKTLSDWHWWFYYNFKWQGSMTRAVSWYKQDRKAKIAQKNIKEFFDLCFFSGTNFQIWSYQSASSLYGNQMQDHKLQAKNYIFEVDGNDHYRHSKRKEISVVSRWQDPIVVDQDAVHYYYNEPKIIELFRDLLCR